MLPISNFGSSRNCQKLTEKLGHVPNQNPVACNQSYATVLYAQGVVNTLLYGENK